jgi:hypothetical protein
MIHSLHIKNYRGFKDFIITPFGRVNLITGSNNVGKTSLLEAIYLNLTPGSAFSTNVDSDKEESSTRHNLFRGFKDLRYNLDNVSKWGWLFYGKDISKDSEIVSSFEGGGTQKLKMYWLISDKDGGIPIPDEIPLDDIPLHLSIYIKNVANEDFSFKIYRNGNEGIPSSYVLDSIPLRLLFNVSSRSQQEDTKWFSKLDDEGRQDEIIGILQLIEPRLRSLAVSTSDGPPMINCDIGIRRRVPMSQMGEGMVRLLSLVLEITNASGGAVLIDEIENGLHHSVLTKVWRAVGEAARRSDTQIFATTHSWECIRAAHEAFLSSDSYDLRLHRLERSGEGVRSVTYDKGTLDTSVEMNLEVR